MMKIKFSKDALKHFEKLESKIQKRIKDKIRILYIYLTQENIIPFSILDIKKLKGEWKGAYRLRVGKFRIIFKVKEDVLYVYDIIKREKAYK